jgi:hypothetical protein
MSVSALDFKLRSFNALDVIGDKIFFDGISDDVIYLIFKIIRRDLEEIDLRNISDKDISTIATRIVEESFFRFRSNKEMLQAVENEVRESRDFQVSEFEKIVSERLEYYSKQEITEEILRKANNEAYMSLYKTSSFSMEIPTDELLNDLKVSLANLDLGEHKRF